jgi:hypothetical protein
MNDPAIKKRTREILATVNSLEFSESGVVELASMVIVTARLLSRLKDPSTKRKCLNEVSKFWDAERKDSVNCKDHPVKRDDFSSAKHDFICLLGDCIAAIKDKEN